MAKKAGKSLENRVEFLLKAMTLEEKVDYIGGFKVFNIRPVARLGLPEIRMSDGPVGCRGQGPANAYPATIGLAATWNTDLAALMGSALARDCRARGVHILLAPGMNMHRSPLCGRNFEYMGEDPFLASRMVVQYIRGLQENGVLACAKHFAGNNQEYDRNNVSSEIDERTLREIYLPAFKAAVQEAKVACVMNSYNLLNGIHCTQHGELNNRILKDEWGFDGILMSDWIATYDAVEAANGGLDLEMPDAKFMNRDNLIPAIRDGRVKESAIDDKVRRILRTILRNGFDRKSAFDPAIPMYDAFGVRASLKIAREAVVLLKNERNALPLRKDGIKSIAVIGPNAHPMVPCGGGSSQTQPFRSVSVLQGLNDVAGDDIEVYYNDGGTGDNIEAIFGASSFLSMHTDGNVIDGLKAEYYANRTLSEPPVRTCVDRHVNFDWPNNRPAWLPIEGFSVRWTGFIKPEHSGWHAFISRSDDGIRVWLDGELIIDNWSIHAPAVDRVERKLIGGRQYDIKIEYFDAGGGAVGQFGWLMLGEPGGSAAARLAKQVDVAVVCVGFDDQGEHEGGDRHFELSATQSALIKAVAKANRNTIVVLFSGGSVATAEWIGKVPAVLHAWYPGEEGGKAIAEILFGAVNPSGKLPMTFDKRWQDNPSHDYYHTTDMKTCYREGIFMGYRGYDRKGAKPLFCFGHGLSYTKFDYSNLKITPEEVEGDDEIIARCDIRNAGRVAGAEVVQLYTGDMEASIERPPKELKGFAKVHLKPRQKKTVTFKVKLSDLAFFDAESHSWVLAPGRFSILVGASSRDIRLKGGITVKTQAR